LTVKPQIVFSHGNSFPASTYGVMLAALRKRGYATYAIDRYGHDPKYPVSDNWPQMVEQLRDFARKLAAKSPEPLYFVGHSMGGYLSVMAAALEPKLCAGIVLVDSPLLGGWKASTLGAMKATRMVGSFSPGAVSRTRRDHWASREEALEHFRHKRAFAAWDERCLADYIDHMVDDAERGGVKLAFDRHIETRIYNTLPDNLSELIRKHPIKCPVGFVGGLQSAEMKQVGMDMTDTLTGGRNCLLPGSHLVPMERPEAVAAAVEAMLRSF
jgi:pimeloyl-ACP methyl ester carboxylesterase